MYEGSTRYLRYSVRTQYAVHMYMYTYLRIIAPPRTSKQPHTACIFRATTGSMHSVVIKSTFDVVAVQHGISCAPRSWHYRYTTATFSRSCSSAIATEPWPSGATVWLLAYPNHGNHGRRKLKSTTANPDIANALCQGTRSRRNLSVAKFPTQHWG